MIVSVDHCPGAFKKANAALMNKFGGNIPYDYDIHRHIREFFAEYQILPILDSGKDRYNSVSQYLFKDENQLLLFMVKWA